MRKKNLRKEILEKRKELTQNQHEIYSKSIINRILESDFYENAKTIMSFISFGDEVDTHFFIKKSIEDGKRIVVPITISEPRHLKVSHLKNFNELEPGFYNILTPKEEYLRFIDPKEIDLIITPGVVFDREGYRIGYGGGYYDRFLVNLPKVPKVAIAFDLQLIDQVPKEDFDIPVDYIFTENEIIECK